ncbi:MAG: HAD family hydrolase, partial [Anaerolineales bacterium]|nr:HAD family hydrolase [Anaerolineales bacterium]
LFDLDNTLLGNDMDSFMPGYFDLLGRYAAPVMARGPFLQALLACTQLTLASVDTAVSNQDTFWQAFEQHTGQRRAELEPFFETFYRTQFPQLAALTQRRPTAAALVQHCFDLGLQVVIATNPLFPRVAIEARLAWAGVPVSAFAYDLVTTYENMHSTKPHPAYYEEILQHLGCRPAEALMVGDDWRNDIVPAAAVGLHTYWLPEPDAPPPDAGLVAACGSLDMLLHGIQNGWLAALAPRAAHEAA